MEVSENVAQALPGFSVKMRGREIFNMIQSYMF